MEGCLVHDDDLITPTEVAELISLGTVAGVSVYRRRYDNFPSPVIEKRRCVLWLRQDVEKRAASRR